MPSVLPPPETLEQRKARQYATLHAIGDLALDLAQTAHANAKQQLAGSRPDGEPDYAVTFAAMSRAVRQTIAIEIRLDAVARPRTTFRPANASVVADPRRILLRDAFHKAADRSRRPEIDAYIDELLAADPDQQTSIDETICTLCNDLKIDLDLARVPDALIFFNQPKPQPHNALPPARASP